MPVILAVYDAIKDIAYWAYIQSHFSKLKDFNLFAAGKSVKIDLPVGNTLDRRSMRRFSRFRNRIRQQMQAVTHDDQ
jgi:hypothetical protein